MSTATLDSMYSVEAICKRSERYQLSEGHSAQREVGLTPNGNPLSGRWVLRNGNGDYVDMDAYRHDLFERHELAALEASPLPSLAPN